ncbi:hypothetical protein JL720_9436 [Aureococcus anophagefferens]|nr:hypothetical protein JL720_9436 [Aureococcus anophagefferens]
MVLARPPEGYGAVGRKSTEWMFVDKKGHDKFGHAGETIIPGAGDSWSHAERRPPFGPADATDAAGDGDDDDFDELPWQVIYIGDPHMVRRLQRQAAYHRQVADHAARHFADDHTGQLHRLAAPENAEHASGAATPTEGAFAAALKRAPRADELKRGRLRRARGRAREPERLAALDLRARGGPLGVGRRRAAPRGLPAALRAPRGAERLDAALGLFPTFGDALEEDVRLALDAGDALGAVRNAERLARVDRDRAGSGTVIAAADGRSGASSTRRRAGRGVGHRRRGRRGHFRRQAHRHLVLGLSRDRRRGARKAYRTASRVYHPDRHGGSNTMFTRVSAAHDCLADAKLRKAYDRGDDLERGVGRDNKQGAAFSEVVSRKYFPEDFGFEPFGDPFERKRDVLERKRREAPPRPTARTSPAAPTGAPARAAPSTTTTTGPVLRCTRCLTGKTRDDFREAAIDPLGCQDDEHVGNNQGTLICERKPDEPPQPPPATDPPPPPRPRRAREQRAAERAARRAAASAGDDDEGDVGDVDSEPPRAARKFRFEATPPGGAAPRFSPRPTKPPTTCYAR